MQASVAALLADLISNAKTIEDFGRVSLLERVAMRIRTDKQYGWVAVLYDWDLGDPVGTGMTEREAILDLLAWLEMEAEEEAQA